MTLVYIVLAMIIAPMLKLENKFSLQKSREIFLGKLVTRTLCLGFSFFKGDY